jgi:NADH-quinone oxidoreductase subunit N
VNVITAATLDSQRLLGLAPLLVTTLGIVVLIIQDLLGRSREGRGGVTLAQAAQTTLVTALLAAVAAMLLWAWIDIRNADDLADSIRRGSTKTFMQNVEPEPVPEAGPRRFEGLHERLDARNVVGQPIGSDQSDVAAELFVATGPRAGDHADTMPGWWGAAINVDRFGLFVTVVICGILALVTLNLLPHLKRHGLYRPELFPLLLMSALGMMLLGFSRDLLLTFISIELLSLPLYVLCGLNQKDPQGRESSLKYFLLGAFASGFFVYGSALLYGVTTHLNYSAIAHTFINMPVANGIAVAGLSLVGVGFAFKLALVPFHAWVPDVYQGAPTPITSFMATGVKLAVGGAFIRFLVEAVHPLPREYWQGALIIFAALSMLIGNLFALHQMSAKRLLAYSAIAHTGYLGVGLATATSESSVSILFYLVAYVLAALGVFVVISYLAPEGQDDIFLDQLHELYQRNPGVCLVMALLLLSLGGFPLTAGFIGKLLIFRDAWYQGLTGLVIFALLNSVVSFYYYLRFVMAMYMQPKVPGAAVAEPQPMPGAYKLAALVTVVLTLLLGILPGRMLDSASRCSLDFARPAAGPPKGKTVMFGDQGE